MAHIVLVTTSFPDGRPGTEAAGSFVLDFATQLSDRIRVTVVAPGSEMSSGTRFCPAVVRFPVPRLPLSSLRPSRLGDWRAIAEALRSGNRTLQRVVRQDRPDHVVALWALPSGYWAESIKKQYGIEYSVWALGSDIWSLGRVPLVKRTLRRVLRGAANRYADGYELATDVERLCGESCRFLPSSRRLPQGRRQPLRAAPPYKLAFLGRWHQNKGVDQLIGALQTLEEVDWMRIEEVRIAGGGPLQAEVEAGAKALARAGRPVSLGGYLDKSAAAELVGWADYLMLPSRIESIPVVFSDALQSGTPLIATPVGDLPRLYRQYGFGVLAREASIQGFATAVREGLNSSPASFAAALAQARGDFDLPTTALKLLDDLGLEYL